MITNGGNPKAPSFSSTRPGRGLQPRYGKEAATQARPHPLASSATKRAHAYEKAGLAAFPHYSKAACTLPGAYLFRPIHVVAVFVEQAVGLLHALELVHVAGNENTL